MKKKDPVNIHSDELLKEIILDSSNLISIRTFKSSYNYPTKFYKPISKLF